MDGAYGPAAANAVAQTVRLAHPVPTVLAVGAFLKSTLCLTRGDEALLSADIGNLDNAESVIAFEQAATALLDMADGAPVAVAHDLHPDFYSTRYAEALAAERSIPAISVQHHHAHVAAVMAEHGTDEAVLGLALDGFGLGDDDASWGGELLQVDAAGYRRLGHLAPLLQPGADKAAREPWRMGAAALHALGRGDEIAARFKDRPGAAIISQMLERGVNAPPTSSCGRLFDAACGLLGVRPIAAFEGEAPMELERLAARPCTDPNGWRLEDGVLDTRPLLARLLDLEPAAGAGVFHGTLAAALAAWVRWAASQTGICRVALCGGCFFNKVLSTTLTEALEADGIETLRPLHLDPGDRAVSLGQAWAAAMALG